MTHQPTAHSVSLAMILLPTAHSVYPAMTSSPTAWSVLMALIIQQTAQNVFLIHSVAQLKEHLQEHHLQKQHHQSQRWILCHPHLFLLRVSVSFNRHDSHTYCMHIGSRQQSQLGGCGWSSGRGRGLAHPLPAGLVHRHCCHGDPTKATSKVRDFSR